MAANPAAPNPADGSAAASRTLLDSSDDSAAPHSSYVEGPPWSKRSTAYQWRPFRGMYQDIRRRAPYYVSDWTLAFRKENLYRVAAATLRMFFIKWVHYSELAAELRSCRSLMPALAYTIDMNLRTGGTYGVNETLLSSAIAAIVFPILGAQPLTIVGVTGLINLFNVSRNPSAQYSGSPERQYTNYAIVVGRHNVNYLQFQAWVYMQVLFFLLLYTLILVAAGPPSCIGSVPSST